MMTIRLNKVGQLSDLVITVYCEVSYYNNP